MTKRILISSNGDTLAGALHLSKDIPKGTVVLTGPLTSIK